jgi:hypothetical protein
MDPDVQGFLAHVGVKGMRWGVKRTDAQLARASGRSSGGSTGESDAKPQGMSRKKKIAIGAGIIGGAALIAAGTYAVNNQMAANKTRTLADARKRAETKLAGEKAARAQIQAFGKKSKWELMTTLPDPPKPAPAQPIKGNKGQQKTKAAVDTFVSKNKWQLMTELPTKQKGVTYSKKDVKKDVKLYGEKGAARIQSKVNKGMLLSKARQQEAVRQNGAKAIKIAMGINSASNKELADYKKLKKLVGK